MSIRQHLRLYLAGQSRVSTVALSNVRRICDQQLTNRPRLDVIDVERRPELAHLDQIIIVPTLVRWFPGPSIKMTGDLSDTKRVMSLIDAQDLAYSGCERHAVLTYLVDAAVLKTAGDAGTVQLLQKPSGFLRTEVHTGYYREFLDAFRYTSQG